jgi:hypothetical protein
VSLTFDETLTVTLGIVGIFFGWLFTYVYFKKGKRSRSLYYSRYVHQMYSYRWPRLSDFQLYYGDRLVTNPQRAEVYLWNQGNEPIERSDISSRDPLKFGAENIEILRLENVRTSRTAVDAELITSADKKHVLIDFALLDEGDGLAFQLYYDTAPSSRPHWASPELTGAVKGIRHGPKLVHLDSDRLSRAGILITFGFFALFATMGLALGYDIFVSGGPWLTITSKVVGLLLITFIVAGLIAFFATSLTIRRYKVPDALGFDERLRGFPDSYLLSIEPSAAQTEISSHSRNEELRGATPAGSAQSGTDTRERRNGTH